MIKHGSPGMLRTTRGDCVGLSMAQLGWLSVAMDD